MNNFGIAFLVTLLGCVVADQPPFPSMNDICEISREPFRQYVDCMSCKLPESVKNIFVKFLECIEEPSFVSLLDSICEAVNKGISKEICEEITKCYIDSAGGDERPTMEETHQAKTANDECFIHLMPYYEIARQKAAADKDDA